MNKEMVAFGDDGFGQYGKNYLPVRWTVNDLSVKLAAKPANNGKVELEGGVGIMLEGYSSKDYGHIVTDRNFELCLRNLLRADNIDPACVKYADVSEQGSNFVVLYLDPTLLCDWA